MYVGNCTSKPVNISYIYIVASYQVKLETVEILRSQVPQKQDTTSATTKTISCVWSTVIIIS